jgi:hypothetical protein
MTSAATRTADHPMRSFLPLVTALALALALAVLTATTVGAAPKDDVGIDDTDGVVVDDPTRTPVPETPVAEPSVVAIPSVSPSPDTGGPSTGGPLDDIVGDPPEENALPDGPSDLYYDVQICDGPVPDLIDDRFCGPYTEGYEGQVYSGTLSAYEVYYFGPLPVELLDMPSGPYLISGEPAPALMKVTLVCTVEDGFGTVIGSFTGQGGSLNLFIGNDLVYRCTQYILPDVDMPSEVEAGDGPVTVIIEDIRCPAGTDPTLNFFGLIGRCGERQEGARWEARSSVGHYERGTTDGAGRILFEVHADTWTFNTFPASSDYAPVFYCNVRDELGQEPERYAPFMTYHHGENGAVMALEQHMTWICVAYTIPTAPGDGSDTADVSATVHACPEGTTSPSLATCSATLPGVITHLLYNAETIVSTKQTDAAGFVSWQAPENLQFFGLAEEAPTGYRLADTALCAMNGGAATAYAVDEFGIIDLGELTAADAVSCALFNIADPNAAPSSDAQLEQATPEELAPEERAPEHGPDAPLATPVVPIDNDGVDAPADDQTGADAPADADADAEPTSTPESGLVPLEEDE